MIYKCITPGCLLAESNAPFSAVINCPEWIIARVNIFCIAAVAASGKTNFLVEIQKKIFGKALSKSMD